LTKTNHHFVPQFYLRNFSENGGSICLVNIEKMIEVEQASIKNQCYRRKFYGSDNKLEDAFAQFEDEVVPLIRGLTYVTPPPKTRNL